jgi:hypothetical protein
MGSQDYVTSLLSLYEACKQLISFVLDHAGETLSYSPNYIFQMVLASAFVLLKLTASPMSEYIDTNSLRMVFNSAIIAVRKISVSNNDLPGRLADVLTQLKARSRLSGENNNWQNLQLNVHSRMSMSITFDSLWQWRKGFEADGRKNLAGTEHTISTDYLQLWMKH